MHSDLSIAERIRRFNEGRRKEHLALKFKALRESPFRFFRGTCHIFYEDWPSDSPLNIAPAAWSCGDLHLENFGSYKGDSRLVYFDMNDFDEAVLAPATWDVTRFLCSVFLACRQMEMDEDHIHQMCMAYLDSYAGTLGEGHSRLVETGTARGIVREFLESLQGRKRRDFLDRRTELKKGGRRLKIDGVKTEAMSDGSKEKLAEMLAHFSKQTEHPEFFRFLDAGYRIAGTSSLGLDRSVMLVEGHGSPDGNYLLDMKQEPGSVVRDYSPCKQPEWPAESHRAAAIQRRMQGIPQALLAPVEFEGRSYLLRELQPTQDRIEIGKAGKRAGQMKDLLVTMGQITGWNQLRSSGRQGSACADELISYGTFLRTTTPGSGRDVVEAARTCADAVVKQYRDYAWAYDDGFF